MILVRSRIGVGTRWASRDLAAKTAVTLSGGLFSRFSLLTLPTAIQTMLQSFGSSRTL